MDMIEFENIYRQTTEVSELLNLDRQYRNYLKEKLVSNPSDASTIMRLGIMAWEPFHEREEAIRYLEHAIALDPNIVDARFWLAKCYYHDYCNYDQAEKLIFEALRLDPTRADCLYLLAGVILDTTEKLDDAIACLEKAIEYAPDWPTLHSFLASLYIRANRLDCAERQASKIRDLAQTPPVRPGNSIDEYYELVVTGRADKDLLGDYNELIDKIQKAKEKRLNYKHTVEWIN